MEPLFRETLKGQRRVLGNKHRYTLKTLERLARLLQKLGRKEEAVGLARELSKLTPKDAKEYPGRKTLLDSLEGNKE